MTNITGIIKTISAWEFADEIAGDFTYEAARLLYDYYSEVSDNIGEPIELDRIAIRCEWHEYDDDKDFISDWLLDDIEGIEEEVSDHCEGDLYGHQAFRLSNGNLLAHVG